MSALVFSCGYDMGLRPCPEPYRDHSAAHITGSATSPDDPNIDPCETCYGYRLVNPDGSPLDSAQADRFWQRRRRARARYAVAIGLYPSLEEYEHAAPF